MELTGLPALLRLRPFCFGHLKWMMDELVWILKGLKNVTGLGPFFLLYISDVGREKMKNVRCLPLNLQDFCLMWLLQ